MRLGRVKLVFTTFSAAFLIFHQLSSSTRTKVHDLKSTVAAIFFFAKVFLRHFVITLTTSRGYYFLSEPFEDLETNVSFTYGRRAHFPEKKESLDATVKSRFPQPITLKLSGEAPTRRIRSSAPTSRRQPKSWGRTNDGSGNELLGYVRCSSV